MANIIEELNTAVLWVNSGYAPHVVDETLSKAAAEIGRLRDRVAELEGLLIRADQFIEGHSGACLGIAMSGKSHPNPDEFLMNFIREAQEFHAAVRATLAAKTDSAPEKDSTNGS